MSSRGFAGFDEFGLSAFLGNLPFNETEILTKLTSGETLSPEEASLIQERWSPQYAGYDKFQAIQEGLNYLSAHPQGSKVSGSFFDSLGGSILANLATGGLYGTFKGLSSGDPL